jgi:hypothetical protein
MAMLLESKLILQMVCLVTHYWDYLMLHYLSPEIEYEVRLSTAVKYGRIERLPFLYHLLGFQKVDPALI